MTPSTMITTREALRRLTTFGISPRPARRVLAVGLAGEPVRTSGAVLYDGEAVNALVRRRVLNPEDVKDIILTSWRAEGVPGGEVLILRRDVRPDAGLEERRALLRLNWRMGWPTAIWLGARRGDGERVAVVTTTGHFVTGGYDVTSVWPYRFDRACVEVDQPGSWFDAVVGSIVPTGPGREWVMVGGDWAIRDLAAHG